MKETASETATGYMAMMHVDVMIPRLICAFLMHLLMEPEVRQALAMLKYVINHKKIRGSLVKLSDEIFKKHIYFLKDPAKKPSHYLYVKYSDIVEKLPSGEGSVWCTDHKGKKKMIPLERIRASKFKISKIGSEISDEILQIAFVLLKRSQRILNIKCRHPIAPGIQFLRQKIGNLHYRDKNN
jgi:hypothetical protein